MKIIECNWNEIETLIGEKQIICFGCGAVSDGFLDLLYTKFKPDKITAFVDNNEAIKVKKYGKRQYDVWNIEKLRKFIRNHVIIVTCSDICGVYSQLGQILELKDTEVYSMYQMLSLRALTNISSVIIKESDTQLIPKKIHYCWFGKNPKPARYIELIDEWKRMCPEFEIIEWNESNYDVSKNKYMKEAYEAQMWAFVSDFARLDIVYHEGGVYLDTDIRLVRNISPLLYNAGFLVVDSDLHVNIGSGFGSVKNNELLKEFMEYYDSIHYMRKDGSFDMRACTFHQYQVLKKYGFVPDGGVHKIKDMTIYPWGINGRDSYSQIDNIVDCTYWLHCGDGTWLDAKRNEWKLKRLNYLREAYERHKNNVGRSGT